MILNKVPQNSQDYPAWELRAIGLMIAEFSDTHHVNLKRQANFLQQKPQVLEFNNRTLLSATMGFNNTQVKFLVTVVNKSTYMFTLVSVNQYANIRTKNMNVLLQAVKAVKYF